MMRWLWRDHPVSTDVKDMVERSFNDKAAGEEGQIAALGRVGVSAGRTHNSPGVAASV